MPDKKRLKDMTAEELDAMGRKEVEDYVADLWPARKESYLRTLAAAKDHVKPIVGLGDSWFDYQPAGFDILDFLQDMDEYEIINHGDAGDTLENMSYGTDYKKRKWKPKKRRLKEALKDLKESQAKVLLLSAGGNDVTGESLEGLLNHASSGLKALRNAHVNFLFQEALPRAFEQVFKETWAVDPSVQIIGHGYGYAIPDGRGVGVFGFNFTGPWLRPALTKKRILDMATQQKIITTLINRFADFLMALDAKHENFHALDLRSMLPPSRDFWENELHLKNSAYKAVAAEFDAKIQEVHP